MELNKDSITQFWEKVKTQAFQTYSDWRGVLTGTDATGVSYNAPIRKFQRGEWSARQWVDYQQRGIDAV